MMNRIGIMLLFGSGVLLGLSRFLHVDDMAPAYIAGIILVVIPLTVFRNARRKSDENRAKVVEEVVKEAQNIVFARREFKSKIPKTKPRQDSKAAYEGSTKVGTARSMASLIRKPRLRETIFDICDFADMILETIRRMPADTPAAVAFVEKHLSKLNEALERSFEMSRGDSRLNFEDMHSPVDACEIECFNTFISTFKRQQDYILFEGLKVKG